MYRYKINNNEKNLCELLQEAGVEMGKVADQILQ